MKIKLSYVVIVFAASGALVLGYLLPKPENAPLSKKAIVAIESVKKSAVVSQATADWSAFDDNLADLPVDEANLYADLSASLSARFATMKSNDALRLANVAALARCAECVALLKTQLLAGNLSKKQFAQLALSLTRGNHAELATMLVEVTAKLLQSKNNRVEVLFKALAKFNSPQVAQGFTDYLAQASDAPRVLQDALINNINESQQRAQVAADLVQRFNATNDSAQQQRLLAINHPETLAQLNAQATAQGNDALAKQSLEQLVSNPSKYTLDALLTLKNSSAMNNDELLNAAYTLANRQFSGNRLDYIESQLSAGAYSEQNKALVLNVLSHSEDAARAAEIVARFANSP